jgi:hypothetical protein
MTIDVLFEKHHFFIYKKPVLTGNRGRVGEVEAVVQPKVDEAQHRRIELCGQVQLEHYIGTILGFAWVSICVHSASKI